MALGRGFDEAKLLFDSVLRLPSQLFWYLDLVFHYERFCSCPIWIVLTPERFIHLPLLEVSSRTTVKTYLDHCSNQVSRSITGTTLTCQIALLS